MPNTPISPSDKPPDTLPETIFDQASCKDRGFCLVHTDHPAPPHRIYYELHGSGPTKILLIMGLKNCSFSWSRQVAGLSSNPQYSVLVFDNRGAGYSDTPRGPYTTTGTALDTLALLDHVGWTRERETHVVGVSMGGMIALKLAVLEPLRIASLLLAVTTAGHGFRRKLPPLDGLEMTARNLFEDEMERYMMMLYPPSWLDEVDEDDPQGRTNRETRIEEHNARMKLVPGQTAAGQFWQLAAASTHHVTTPELERINREIPKVAILSAKKDTLIPPSSSLNLKKHMEDAELIQWEGSGHAIHSQHPTRFNELVERVCREGLEAAGPPRTWKTDSLRLIRSKEDATAPSPTSFYPRGLAEMLERYWTPTPSAPSTTLSTQASETEGEVSETPSHLRSPGDTGSSVGKVVSFQKRDHEEEATQAESRHNGLRDLVERVMRNKKEGDEHPNEGDATSSPTTPHRPHRFADLVERVLSPGALCVPHDSSFFGLGALGTRRSKSRGNSPTRRPPRIRRASELPERMKSEEKAGGERAKPVLGGALDLSGGRV